MLVRDTLSYPAGIPHPPLFRWRLIGGTDNAPAIAPRTGRPPLNRKPAPVRLSPEVLARIDEVIGNYGHSAFIREAVKRELQWRGK